MNTLHSGVPLSSDAHALFTALGSALIASLHPGETLLLNWRGEDSTFVRLSRDRIRQAGTVRQATLELELIAAGRCASATIDIGADALAAAITAIQRLRAFLPLLPADPHLVIGTAPLREQRDAGATVIAAEVAISELVAMADDLDVAGIWASGTIERGFISSHGADCWHAVALAQLDASAYRPDGQAVKFGWAGRHWDRAAISAELARVRQRLDALAAPIRDLAPGPYRALLEPAAVNDLIAMLCWGGFSCRARRTRTSPLLRLETGATLSPAVTISEDLASGLAPTFTKRGFLRPQRVELIRAGVLGDPLVDARSAAEYHLPTTCGEESPDSLVMAGGDLNRADALARLGTGLWIGNLWYCNWSDHSAARITGMTRFACLWVENGVPVAPIRALRFDDTVEHLFGGGLEALTRETTTLPDNSTYGGRGTRQVIVPGMLIEGMRFTL